jgi:hypothetical protein
MRQFREGMAIGYALDENGEPEDQPTALPPGLLPTHYGRFGTTGSGKSKALGMDGEVLVASPFECRHVLCILRSDQLIGGPKTEQCRL